jgi:hypothetical protein
MRGFFLALSLRSSSRAESMSGISLAIMASTVRETDWSNVLCLDGAPPVGDRGSLSNPCSGGHMNREEYKPRPWLKSHGLGGARTHNRRLKRAIFSLDKLLMLRGLGLRHFLLLSTLTYWPKGTM